MCVWQGAEEEIKKNLKQGVAKYDLGLRWSISLTCGEQIGGVELDLKREEKTALEGTMVVHVSHNSGVSS